MKRLIAVLLGICMLFILFCGCKDTDTDSSNISNSSDIHNSSSKDNNSKNTESNTDNTQLYLQFLNGEITAKGSDGSLKYIDECTVYGELPQDYKYTFFDVNFDGEKELCVSEYKYKHCFRIIDGEIDFYVTEIDTKFLTNGALFYDFSGVEYHQCIYKDSKLEMNFEHYTDYSENTEEYFIGAAPVSKEEYYKRLSEYLSIPEVDWYDRYGNVVVNLPEVHDKIISIIRNESTYINESGKSIYFSESASDYYVDDLIARPKQFTYFDVDRDGEREMVVGITLGSEYVDHYVILDHDDGNIYGHLLGIRSLQILKKDGTFNQSSGAATNQIALLKLDKTKIEFTVLAENDDMDNIYKIDGKDVSKEEIDTYYEQFNAKEDCDWSDFETLNLIEQ